MIYRASNLLLVCLLIAASPLAKAESDIYSTFINWRAGDVFNYTVTKDNERLLRGGGVARSSVESKIKLDVLSRVDNVFEVNWIVGETLIQSGPDASNKLAQDLVNMMQGVVLKLVIDNKGIRQDLKNFESVKAKIIGTFEMMIAAQVKAGELSKDQGDELKGLAMQPFQSKEVLLRTALPEVALFFAAYGYELSAEKFVTFEGEMSNPLGGEAFPMNGTVEFSGFNPDNNTIKVSWAQTPVPKDFNRIVKDSLASLPAIQQVATPTAEQLSNMKRINKAVYVLDRDTGVMQRIQHRQTVNLGTIRSNETMKFQLESKDG